tara:strand:- start:367 stop:666 length:300 start_codon:yes stop_codon:yes gene_type:complete
MTESDALVVRLKALAEKAGPGLWARAPMESEWGDGYMICDRGGRGNYVAHVYINVKAKAKVTTDKWQAGRRATFDYIAACSPDVILGLISRIEELEKNG